MTHFLVKRGHVLSSALGENDWGNCWSGKKKVFTIMQEGWACCSKVL